jgi:hypothetical protein
MKTIKSDVQAKCYLCGSEEILYYTYFVEFLCKKDRERVMKLIDKLKKRRTRTTVAAMIKKYSDNGGDNGGQTTGS